MRRALPVLGDPVVRLGDLAVRVPHLDAPTEPEDVIEVQYLVAVLVQGRVAEATIAENGDAYAWRKGGTKCVESIGLVLAAVVLERIAAHGLPDERRGTAVRGDQVHSDAAVSVARVLGPVDGDHDLGAVVHHPRHPGAERVLHHHALIAEESIDLLDGVLRVDLARTSEAPSDVVDAERVGVHHADDAVGDREAALRMERVAEDAGDEIVDLRRRDQGLGEHAAT